MDRSKFYKYLKNNLSPKLSQGQVDGLEACLNEGERRKVKKEYLAAILAECWHETGGQMEPVKETVYADSTDRNPSDATVIKRLDSAFSKGQLPWVKTPYWKDGWFGRGVIQLTHKANYDKFNVNKETALQLIPSVRVAFDGILTGGFTGKKARDYDDAKGYRYSASRATVNGDTKANGPKIEKYGRIFEGALTSAGYK